MDTYENQRQTTKKVYSKQYIEAQIYTCESILNYLKDRKDILTGVGKMFK